MAENHLKKCSPSLIIRERQIKTTLRFHLKPVRMAKIKKNQDTSGLWRDVEKRNTPPLLEVLQAGTTNMENSLVVPQKTWHTTSRGPCYTPCGHTPCHAIRTHAQIHSWAALFIIFWNWIDPRCPSKDEWIQKMWCIYTMEYYSASKNNDFMTFFGKWVEMENIVLNEIIQAQNSTYEMQSLTSGY